jgi:DNA-binding CsgD family transcriptional regulator
MAGLFFNITALYSGLLTSVFSRSPHLVDKVLQLLVQGIRNKEIAAKLSITERIVKFHISSILGKLGAGNRTEAVTIALQKGLVDL